MITVKLPVVLGACLVGVLLLAALVGVGIENHELRNRPPGETTTSAEWEREDGTQVEARSSDGEYSSTDDIVDDAFEGASRSDRRDALGRGGPFGLGTADPNVAIEIGIDGQSEQDSTGWLAPTTRIGNLSTWVFQDTLAYTRIDETIEVQGGLLRRDIFVDPLPDTIRVFRSVTPAGPRWTTVARGGTVDYVVGAYEQSDRWLRGRVGAEMRITPDVTPVAYAELDLRVGSVLGLAAWASGRVERSEQGTAALVGVSLEL